MTLSSPKKRESSKRSRRASKDRDAKGSKSNRYLVKHWVVGGCTCQLKDLVKGKRDEMRTPP
jgi:hypothetical protein